MCAFVFIKSTTPKPSVPSAFTLCTRSLLERRLSCSGQGNSDKHTLSQRRQLRCLGGHWSRRSQPAAANHSYSDAQVFVLMFCVCWARHFQGALWAFFWTFGHSWAFSGPRKCPKGLVWVFFWPPGHRSPENAQPGSGGVRGLQVGAGAMRWGPEGRGGAQNQKTRGLEGGDQKGGGARRVGAQNFAFFFVYCPAANVFLFFSPWVFSWNCGRDSRPWTTSCARLGFSGVIFCEPRRLGVLKSDQPRS